MIFKKKIPVPEVLVENSFTAGGCVLSGFLGQEISDYDVYPKSQDKIFDILTTIVDDYSAYITNVSDRSITLISNSLQDSLTKERKVIQVVTLQDFPTAESIFETFDFTVCMAAFDGDDKTFHHHDCFYRDLASRQINFNVDTKFPYASLVRTKKYIKKGFQVSKSEYLKMGMAIARKGLPDSWDELAHAIGGFYGKSAILQVEDKEYTFENVIDYLSNPQWDYMDAHDILSETKLFGITISDMNKIIKDGDETVFNILRDLHEGKNVYITKMGNNVHYLDNDMLTDTVVLHDPANYIPFYNNAEYRAMKMLSDGGYNKSKYFSRWNGTKLEDNANVIPIQLDFDYIALYYKQDNKYHFLSHDRELKKHIFKEASFGEDIASLVTFQMKTASAFIEQYKKNNPESPQLIMGRVYFKSDDVSRYFNSGDMIWLKSGKVLER